MDITIYHNPQCSKSRRTLELIRQAGFEPLVVEYLKTPPSKVLLQQLIAHMNVPARSLLRDDEALYAELGLDDELLTDDQLVDAMVAHPGLINRPIVAGPRGVGLCRPPEAVFDLLPAGSMPSSPPTESGTTGEQVP